MFTGPFSSAVFFLLSLFPIFSRGFNKMSPSEMCIKLAHFHNCNSHLDSTFHCQCATDDLVSSSSQLPSCFAALPFVEFPDEQLLSIGIALPAMDAFLNDPEGVFLDDLELYTFIPTKCVLIYRRGCSEEGDAYEFQIGIHSSKCGLGNVAIGQPLLKSLSALMFLKNRSFMTENPLKIAYVRKVISSPWERKSRPTDGERE